MLSSINKVSTKFYLYALYIVTNYVEILIIMIAIVEYVVIFGEMKNYYLIKNSNELIQII